MTYDSQITITVPASLADIAAMIGRAMDTDIGGEYSFSKDILNYTESGEPVYADTISCKTVCHLEFRQQAFTILANPDMLYQICQQDYNRRWPDTSAPTLQQCREFVANAKLS